MHHHRRARGPARGDCQGILATNGRLWCCHPERSEAGRCGNRPNAVEGSAVFLAKAKGCEVDRRSLARDDNSEGVALMMLYDLSAKLNNGRNKKLADYKGKVLLIVNTASECGFTPQYDGLQSLYAKYKERGFEVLGFPCDQFGHQEPGSDDEIKSFCQLNYGVSFPLFSKIEVNGNDVHPVFKFLKSEKGGLLGDAITWNFTKFLVDKKGNVIERFAPTTPPSAIEPQIEKLLEQ